MKWSLGKKSKDAVVLPAPVEKRSLFSRRGEAKSGATTEAAEVTDFVELSATSRPLGETGSREPYLGADVAATEEAGGNVSHSDFALPGFDPELAALAAGQATEADLAAESIAPLEPGADVTAALAEDAPPAKASRWGKAGKKSEKAAKLEKPVNAAKAAKQQSSAAVQRPLKVLIGYLPDSSERDTYFYMLGVAEKNLDSENIGWAALTKFESGYAYEIHEGGNGRGYLDSLISHFRSLPAFSAEETHRAYIRTATRTVRVERTAKGLYSVMLPEADETPQSEWLVANKKLSALVEKRTGLFLGGVVLFLSSLVALMGGYATRYQPYTASVVNIERVAVNTLPHSQWNKLMNLPAGDYVMALKYEKNEWLIQTPSNPSGRAAKPVAKQGGRAVRGPRTPGSGAVPSAPVEAGQEAPGAGSKTPPPPIKH